MPNRVADANIATVIEDMANAGKTLSAMGASEGAAGNLSVYLEPGQQVPSEFYAAETIVLPEPVPELAEAWFVVSGSGTRMRDITSNPGGCLALLLVAQGGLRATLYQAKTRNYSRITSEFNSHLVVHRSHVRDKGLKYHAVVHAQPRKLTYLSHVTAYQDENYLNRRLLRWQPEAILNFPEGLGLIAFQVPGQRELMEANLRVLRERRLAIWAKHGVMARSSHSVQAAVDLIEYAETAAEYECLDRSLGGQAEGLSAEELAQIATAYGVQQTLF